MTGYAKEFRSSPQLDDSVAALAPVVHDIWRSTARPGILTPFEPDIYEHRGNGPAFDIANTEAADLPEPLVEISRRTAKTILHYTHKLIDNEAVDAEVMENSASWLYANWEMIKYNWYDGSYPSLRRLVFSSESDRVRNIDHRLMLAGTASLLDKDRYPIWDVGDPGSGLSVRERLLGIPGVAGYAVRGQAILEFARTTKRPLPYVPGVDLDLDYYQFKTDERSANV